MKYFNKVKSYTALCEPEIDFLTMTAMSVPKGNIVVAGTYKGGDVMSMMLASPFRDYHVLDSFCGLADPVEEDIVNNPKPDITTMISGEFSCGGIERYLKNFDEQKLVRPITYAQYITDESLKGIDPGPVSFLWLDLDHYAPTKACLNYFDKFLIPGAIIACHDYGFVRCPGIKPACNEYSDSWVHGAGGIYYMEK